MLNLTLTIKQIYSFQLTALVGLQPETQLAPRKTKNAQALRSGASS